MTCLQSCNPHTGVTYGRRADSRRHNMTRNLLVLTCALSAMMIAHADQLTLPQMARLNAPKPVYVQRSRELMPVALDDIVATADLIVHGTVAPTSTYLSDDQKDMYTDYEVT